MDAQLKSEPECVAPACDLRALVATAPVPRFQSPTFARAAHEQGSGSDDEPDAASVAKGSSQGGKSNDTSSVDQRRSRRASTRRRSGLAEAEDHPGPLVLSSCAEFLARMAEIRADCAAHGLVPLYHYTTPGVAPLIADTGFRMSTQGQGDGGVYFSTLGPASYDLGSEKYEENIIVDCTCLGPHALDDRLTRLWKHKNWCNFFNLVCAVFFLLRPHPMVWRLLTLGSVAA